MQLGKASELCGTLEEQSFEDYLSKMIVRKRKVLSFIVWEYSKRKEPIPVRDISKALQLGPSRTWQLITAVEQYEIITTELRKKRGDFGVVTPDESLIREVASMRSNCHIMIV